MIKTILAAILLTYTVMTADATLRLYPAGEGVETIQDFKVVVREPGNDAWQCIDVYPVAVDRVENARHNREIASMAYFDCDGKVEIAVIARSGIDSARVRPLSFKIEPTVSADTLFFGVCSPANLSVEVNGDIFHNLHLFVNPVDYSSPDRRRVKRDRSLLYFPPGVHRVPGDSLHINSGTTVYVDGGARLEATLIVDNAQDVNIIGRGEIHPRGRGEGIYVRNSRRVSVDGVIVTQLPVGNCDSVTVTNVKAISSYNWGDGLNVFASRNVSYDRCFCRTSDDCTTVYATRKGFSGSSCNITMTRTVLWADVAHPIMIGLHGNPASPDTISNLTYRDIDILDHKEKQIDYQGCMAIECGDENLVENVTFDNIRVEDFREGQLLNLRVVYNAKYCTAPGRAIRNVHFKNITYNGSGEEMSVITGWDESRPVENITFDNLVINGIHIHDTMPQKPKWYKTSDFAHLYVGDHVKNLTFN